MKKCLSLLTQAMGGASWLGLKASSRTKLPPLPLDIPSSSVITQMFFLIDKGGGGWAPSSKARKSGGLSVNSNLGCVP